MRGQLVGVTYLQPGAPANQDGAEGGKTLPMEGVAEDTPQGY